MSEEILIKMLVESPLAVVAFYALVKINGTLQKLTDAVVKMSVENDKRLSKIEDTVAEIKARLPDSKTI